MRLVFIIFFTYVMLPHVAQASAAHDERLTKGTIQVIESKFGVKVSEVGLSRPEDIRAKISNGIGVIFGYDKGREAHINLDNGLTLNCIVYDKSGDVRVGYCDMYPTTGDSPWFGM